MTTEQAIEILTNAIQTKNVTVEQDIALEKAQKALEKQIPKKPTLFKAQYTRYTMEYKCPSCKRVFIGMEIGDYCYHCGQALDWDVEYENKGF